MHYLRWLNVFSLHLLWWKTFIFQENCTASFDPCKNFGSLLACLIPYYYWTQTKKILGIVFIFFNNIKGHLWLYLLLYLLLLLLIDTLKDSSMKVT